MNGLGDPLFGQVAYCDSVPFYAAADRAITAGRLRIPTTGRSPRTGSRADHAQLPARGPGPQRQRDHRYLLTATGQTAQDSAANAALLLGAGAIDNGSDNTLLDSFVLPALGLRRVLRARPVQRLLGPGTSQTLDELSRLLAQRAPIALVPENDPMTTANGARSAAPRPTCTGSASVSRWSTGAQQRAVRGFHARAGSRRRSRRTSAPDMLNIETAFIAANWSRFSAGPSPLLATGSDLVHVHGCSLSASFTSFLAAAPSGWTTRTSLTQDAQGRGRRRQAQPGRGATQPARPEPARPEPPRPEPARPEPARPEPARPEPAGQHLVPQRAAGGHPSIPDSLEPLDAVGERGYAD